MALDWLLNPVSTDQPCGPDLEKADDPQFLDYYFEAEARLPERYFITGAANAQGGTEDRLFDPRSVDLRRETAAITTLLQRSRDLRLLSLLARFQILAGRLGDFAGTLETVAALLKAWMSDLHPQKSATGLGLRGVLDTLSEQPTVVMPLLHLPVIASPKLSYRIYQVASGPLSSQAAEGDDATDPAKLIAALQSPAHQGQARMVYRDLTRADDALHRISALCQGQGADGFTPDFSATQDAIAAIQSMLVKALPDLKNKTTKPASERPAVSAPPIDQEDRPVSAHSINTFAEAVAALEGCQTYLATCQPSSLSLLLITQARALVGASIVEVMELLMPQQVAQARLKLGQGPGFTIDIEQMRALSKSSGPSEQNIKFRLPIKPVSINKQSQLASYLRGVENFYHDNEPASPIPVLVSTAENMLSKSFHSIMSEILPDKAGDKS